MGLLIFLQQRNELLHGGGEHFVFLVDDGELAEELDIFEAHLGQGLFLDFLDDGGLGDDGHAGFDFDGAFDRFDIIELHDGVEGDPAILEGAVDGLACGDIGFEGDDLFVGDLGDLDRFLFGEGVVGAADQDHGVLFHGDDLQFAILDGERDEPHVDHIAEDVFVDLIGAAVFHVDVDGGVGSEEFLDVGGEVVEADAVDGGDADRAGHNVLDFLEAAMEGFVSLDYLFAEIVEDLAFPCEAEFFLAAFDQEGLELAFEGADLLADCGLRYPIDMCGFGETFRFCQVTKNL